MANEKVEVDKYALQHLISDYYSLLKVANNEADNVDSIESSSVKIGESIESLFKYVSQSKLNVTNTRGKLNKNIVPSVNYCADRNSSNSVLLSDSGSTSTNTYSNKESEDESFGTYRSIFTYNHASSRGIYLTHSNGNNRHKMKLRYNYRSNEFKSSQFPNGRRKMKIIPSKINNSNLSDSDNNNEEDSGYPFDTSTIDKQSLEPIHEKDLSFMNPYNVANMDNNDVIQSNAQSADNMDNNDVIPSNAQSADNVDNNDVIQLNAQSADNVDNNDVIPSNVQSTLDNDVIQSVEEDKLLGNNGEQVIQDDKFEITTKSKSSGMLQRFTSEKSKDSLKRQQENQENFKSSGISGKPDRILSHQSSVSKKQSPKERLSDIELKEPLPPIQKIRPIKFNSNDRFRGVIPLIPRSLVFKSTSIDRRVKNDSDSVHDLHFEFLLEFEDFLANLRLKIPYHYFRDLISLCKIYIDLPIHYFDTLRNTTVLFAFLLNRYIILPLNVSALVELFSKDEKFIDAYKLTLFYQAGVAEKKQFLETIAH